MIIAPSRLFLNYISEILPELGVERVKQTTFEDLAVKWIGARLKIVEANEKLMGFVNHNTTKEQQIRNKFIKKESEFKSSIAFCNYCMLQYLRVEDIADNKYLNGAIHIFSR
jgi:DNA helicase-2/ATP-dependent DNA helicase PcrA